jgi:hypothetical protein
VLSYSCLGYVAYVYMSWFYLYLVNVRGFDILRGGFFASAPFLAILVFCPIGGWVTDRLAPATDSQLVVDKQEWQGLPQARPSARAWIDCPFCHRQSTSGCLFQRRRLLVLHQRLIQDARRQSLRLDEHGPHRGAISPTVTP